MDLYQELCNKLGKAKVWILTADELLDEVEGIVEEKIKQAQQEKAREIFRNLNKIWKKYGEIPDFEFVKLEKKHIGDDENAK